MPIKCDLQITQSLKTAYAFFDFYYLIQIKISIFKLKSRFKSLFQ